MELAAQCSDLKVFLILQEMKLLITMWDVLASLWLLGATGVSVVVVSNPLRHHPVWIIDKGSGESRGITIECNSWKETFCSVLFFHDPCSLWRWIWARWFQCQSLISWCWWKPCKLRLSGKFWWTCWQAFAEAGEVWWKCLPAKPTLLNLSLRWAQPRICLQI